MSDKKSRITPREQNSSTFGATQYVAPDKKISLSQDANNKLLFTLFQINLLQKENQLVVEVPDLNADAMRRRSRSLLTAIEEKTGLYAGLEKLTSRHYLGENGTLESDTKGTDVWLYLIDPNSGEILTRESKPVKK